MDNIILKVDLQILFIFQNPKLHLKFKYHFHQQNLLANIDYYFFKNLKDQEIDITQQLTLNKNKIC
jgi:hypothetical protein